MLKIFSIRKRDGERAVGTRDGHCNKGREVRLERGKRKGTEVVRNWDVRSSKEFRVEEWGEVAIGLRSEEWGEELRESGGEEDLGLGLGLFASRGEKYELYTLNIYSGYSKIKLVYLFASAKLMCIHIYIR
jgi:hypothetical protein